MLANKELKHEQREAEKKKPKMNTFTPRLLVADVLIHPPSQCALQKLSTFDYVEMWYFSLAGHPAAARHHNRSQANNTFGISKINDHLTVHSRASIRASCNALLDHELSFSEFLRAKNCFLEYAKKTNCPTTNLNAFTKFFWFLETHPLLQLPLGEKIILTYALHVHHDRHWELKAEQGYDISIINNHLLDTVT
ncbi:hypothetical protein PAXINDRAFT_66155 [Paxillus involutus ATCC 200175]|nr:hypothetical protein PAXINDRAFT_66155 [Paxillus involutus ATCC 200175]